MLNYHSTKCGSVLNRDQASKNQICLSHSHALNIDVEFVCLRSAYLLYYFDVHQIMQQEIPNLPQSEINKRISESWKRLSVAEKAYYLEKAKSEKEGTDTVSCGNFFHTGKPVYLSICGSLYFTNRQTKTSLCNPLNQTKPTHFEENLELYTSTCHNSFKIQTFIMRTLI